MADGGRNRLRPDAGFVDTERRHGVGCRHLLLDDVHDGTRYGDSQQGHDFTATDAADYNTVAGSVSVTVNKATPTVSAWPTASPITYGQT